MKNAVVENNKVMSNVCHIEKSFHVKCKLICGHFQDQYWIIQKRIDLNCIIDFINPDFTEPLQVILYFGNLAFIIMSLFLGKAVPRREV